MNKPYVVRLHILLILTLILIVVDLTLCWMWLSVHYLVITALHTIHIKPNYYKYSTPLMYQYIQTFLQRSICCTKSTSVILVGLIWCFMPACVFKYMWVRPDLCICVWYPSVCPVMKAVNTETNPTISTSCLNGRDIFTLSMAMRRRKAWERGADIKEEEKHMGKESTTFVKMNRERKVQLEVWKQKMDSWM